MDINNSKTGGRGGRAAARTHLDIVATGKAVAQLVAGDCAPRINDGSAPLGVDVMTGTLHATPTLATEWRAARSAMGRAWPTLPAGAWSDAKILETLEMRVALAAMRGQQQPVTKYIIATLSNTIGAN